MLLLGDRLFCAAAGMAPMHQRILLRRSALMMESNFAAAAAPMQKSERARQAKAANTPVLEFNLK